jgi:RNA polymerase sigma-70 factor (ECF subfamily)
MAAPADPTSSALDTVVTRFARLVRSVAVAHGLFETDLDEVVQDVRIRLWRARDAERISDTSSSYVYHTARSAALDLVRRRRISRAVPVGVDGSALERVAEPTARPDRAAEEAELAEVVFQEVGALIDSRRVPVRMHLLGYEAHEIAVRLGWSGAKTRNLLSRGMADLRARLDARGIGPEGIR